MSHLELLLSEMFPPNAEGWPAFAECCAGFLPRLDPNLRETLERQLGGLDPSFVTDDSVNEVVTEMRRREPQAWARFEELVVREYFSSEFFRRHFVRNARHGN